MLASTAYAVRVGKSSLTFSGPIARRKSAATECVLSGNTSSIMPPPCSRPVGHSEDVAKALQRRSRVAQGLNVQKGVRLGLSLAAALLGGLFQHPLGSTPRPLVIVRVTPWATGSGGFATVSF